METCPWCGSNRVYRSRTRTAFERLRRQFTRKRLYRCHACQWRGWAPVGLRTVAARDAFEAAAAPHDRPADDGALDDPARKTRE